MGTDYIVFLCEPLIEISLGVKIKIENLATSIFKADAKNEILFFTDNNILYMKQFIGDVADN